MTDPSAFFKNVTRDNFHSIHYEKKVMVPPVGTYSSSYNYVYPDVHTKNYGTRKNWDGRNIEDSLDIKFRDFLKNSEMCPRAERSLVKYREHEVSRYQKILHQ